MSFLNRMELAQRPTGTILGFLIVFAGFVVSGLAPLALGITADTTSTFKGQFLLTIGFLIWITLIFIWVKFREGRPISSLGYGKGTITQTFAGALAGIALTSIVVGLSVATGQATLGKPNWAVLGSAMILLLGFAVQASAEEIAYRGYLSQVLGRKLPATIVITLQAIIFTAGHVGNGLNPIAIVTMLVVSYFLMMWILATGNLWGAMAFHTFWNWSQANFWGAAVSNIHMDTHVFSFTPSGSALLTGGAFGLEGSLLTIFMLLLGGIYFHRKWRQQNHK